MDISPAIKTLPLNKGAINNPGKRKEREKGRARERARLLRRLGQFRANVSHTAIFSSVSCVFTSSLTSRRKRFTINHTDGAFSRFKLRYQHKTRLS